MATEAKELFEKALELDPANDSTKVGLGASLYFRSAGRRIHGGDARDTADIRSCAAGFHQYVCTVYAGGGRDRVGPIRQSDGTSDHCCSGTNLPISKRCFCWRRLNQQKGDKTEAVRCYEAAKKLIGNPEMVRDIDQRIKALR